MQHMLTEASAASQRLNFEMNNNDMRQRLGQIMACIEGTDYLDNEDIERVILLQIIHFNNVSAAEIIIYLFD